MNSSGFKLIEKLSESTTTAVYKAFQVALNRTVLLKILHKHLANDPEFKARFVREAHACARLHSVHIVQVYDLTEIDGSPAIVMEFVDGQSLKQRLGDGNPQAPEFAKKVTVAVLEGLLVAHQYGVIHRDLKPGNILVSDDSIVKITDFGLASLAVSSTVTAEGMVVGTPAYMSPEQIRGETLDARSDLFSLGVTIVEALTGRKIFDGNSYSECIRKIAAFKTESLADLRLNIPDSFLQFLVRLMEPSRDRRFRSAREALEALGYKKDEPALGAEAKARGSMALPIVVVSAALLVIVGVLLQKNAGGGPGGAARTDSLTAPLQRDDGISQAKDLDSRSAGHESRQQSSPSSSHNVVADANTSEGQAADSGFLAISAKPWAKIYVNNQYLGETPLSAPLKIKAGVNTVAFNYRMFGPIVKTVTITPNKTATVDVNFLDSAGYVLLQVTPWAYVYVDDQYYDVTPFNSPLIIPSGKRRIRFHNPAFEDMEKEISVGVNDTLRLSVNYSDKRGDIKK